MSSKQQPPTPRRPYSSSPPSPKVNLKLTRANSEFYAPPTFDEPKRKSSSLLPSPTTLEVKPLPKDPFGANHRDDLRHGSRPSSPIITNMKPSVALTVATPVQPHPPRHSLTDAEGDVFMDSQETFFDQGLVPFKVNPADIPNRASSVGSNLTEKEQLGFAKLKRLSTEGLSVSREGSPVPTSRTSEESTRTFINRIDELNTLTENLKVNLQNVAQENQTLETDRKQLLKDNQTREADHKQLLKAYEDLRRQNQDLQSKMAKRDRDYDIMSKNYLDHVRLIRATDDDHSTIIDRLNQLKTSIEHMVRKTQGTKSVNLNKPAAIEHFRKSGLLEDFPISEDQLEPYHLNLYMESAVMSSLVSAFFDKPLSCIFDFNKGFKDIYDWMHQRNSKLAVRWRQQLCVMLTQDPETKTRQEAAVTKTAGELTELMSKVYNNSDEGTKIRDLCGKAFDLAVAMTALESVISPATVALGTPFDDENMATSLKSNTDGAVALVIFPAFKDSESFTIRPKVWCH
ncbi:hypothetical protein EDD21DRAFT_369855 [Dissophora ornata]|nr:hypothetical protein BGZ58_011007 [Dissophora ornata]KAI8603162.1 hypothetical protein EDD21DRAFT_369855 [Dissophora ornata]